MLKKAYLVINNKPIKMKKIILSLLICCLWTTAKAQDFYEASWESGGVTYVALLVEFDSDAFFRVNYSINGVEKIVEYKCQFMSNIDYVAEYIDGYSPRFIKGGGESSSYNADNFYFLSSSSALYASEKVNVFTRDDALPMAKESDIKTLTRLKYWDVINDEDLSPSYLKQFFLESEKYYTQFASLYSGSYDNTTISNDAIGAPEKDNDDRLIFVMSRSDKYNYQSWNQSKDFPRAWIRDKWDDGYDITDISYFDEMWFVVMSDIKGLTTQSWKTDETFPKEWIANKWDEGYYINEVSYGEDDWAIVMSKGTGFTNQSWKTSLDFPTDWISSKKAEGYLITDATCKNGMWAVVMSKGSNYYSQEYELSNTYPGTWVKENWSKGLAITTATNGNGKWFVVMSKGSNINRQAFNRTEELPKHYIRNNWDNNLYISDIALKTAW